MRTPDVHSPQFAAEAHRQSAMVATARADDKDMEFVEAVSEDWIGGSAATSSR